MRLILALALLLPAIAGAQPRRIVSTTPSITEMLFALGLGDRVVGVTTFCRYPDEAKRLPKVGTYIQPNMEVILSLKPDLVIIQENPVRLREKLEGLRLRVMELEHKSVEDVYASIDRIGQVAGLETRAQTLNTRIQEDMEQIREQAGKQPKRRMLFIVGRTPQALEGLIAVGRASYLNALMEIAGGENILRDAGSAYPKISLETVLARDPEVIVDMGEMAETVGVTEEDKRRVVELWKRFPAITAVRKNRVHAVASDIFVVPGPRMVDAARAFARMIHQEAGF